MCRAVSGDDAGAYELAILMEWLVWLSKTSSCLSVFFCFDSIALCCVLKVDYNHWIGTCTIFGRGTTCYFPLLYSNVIFLYPFYSRV